MAMFNICSVEYDFGIENCIARRIILTDSGLLIVVLNDENQKEILLRLN